MAPECCLRRWNIFPGQANQVWICLVPTLPGNLQAQEKGCYANYTAGNVEARQANFPFQHTNQRSIRHALGGKNTSGQRWSMVYTNQTAPKRLCEQKPEHKTYMLRFLKIKTLNERNVLSCSCSHLSIRDMRVLLWEIHRLTSWCWKTLDQNVVTSQINPHHHSKSYGHYM